ncbi:MAG: flagellar biosynthesis protein FlhF [Phycisphaerales bacterium]
MKLKTYRAKTMADALVEVKKDLGADAVILHTRSFRVGSLMGFGGRSMVEITASSAAERRREPMATAPTEPPRSRAGIRHTAMGTYTAAPRVRPPSDPFATPKQDADAPEVVVPRAVDLPVRRPVHTDVAPEAPKPALAVAPAPAALSHATTNASATGLEREVADLRRMMGQVLQSTRQTAVAVGKSGAGMLPGATSGPLFDLYAHLIEEDVDNEVAERLASAVRDELNADELPDARIVRETMLRHIGALIPVRQDRPTKTEHGARRIALIGPTGVGKTTTVAKLAATYKLRYALDVALVTIDTYRIAAVEQLRTYASIIGLPIEVVNTPEEMRVACAKFASKDAVFIDTAGRSQNDRTRLTELSSFIDAAKPDETHLVLSSTASTTTLARIAERFRPLGPDRFILTKLDEAVTFGVIAGLCEKIALPVSFVTTGQEVPDHLEPARAERLARLVIDGPSRTDEPPASHHGGDLS